MRFMTRIKFGTFTHVGKTVPALHISGEDGSQAVIDDALMSTLDYLSVEELAIIVQSPVKDVTVDFEVPSLTRSTAIAHTLFDPVNGLLTKNRIRVRVTQPFVASHVWRSDHPNPASAPITAITWHHVPHGGYIGTGAD